MGTYSDPIVILKLFKLSIGKVYVSTKKMILD